MQDIKKIMIVGRLSAYRAASWKLADMSEGLTLFDGMKFDVQSYRMHDGHYDFLLVSPNGPVSCTGCPAHTFIVLNADGSLPQPVFSRIRTRRALNATDLGINRTVAIPVNHELFVDTVYPNDAEWHKNFVFSCHDAAGRKLRITGVSRISFGVVEGEGQSVWDDDVLQL